MQALDWLFAKRLIVPSTIVRYDDWPRSNATHLTLTLTLTLTLALALTLTLPPALTLALTLTLT